MNRDIKISLFCQHATFFCKSDHISNNCRTFSEKNNLHQGKIRRSRRAQSLCKLLIGKWLNKCNGSNLNIYVFINLAKPRLFATLAQQPA
jgi:hypothetical protein